MKKHTAVLAFLLVMILLFTSCAHQADNKSSEAADGGGGTQEDFAYDFSADSVLTGKHYVEMKVRDYGTMIIEVDADAAPISAKNFLRLVSIGFYDGLTFHRIQPGFMAQGGDGRQSELADQAATIYGEFAANGYDNPISHTRGTISMARTNVYDSASSQFFIMHQDWPSIDGAYAAFGHVIRGIEVVDAMCDAADTTTPNYIQPEEKRPVIEYAKLLGTKNPLE